VSKPRVKTFKTLKSSLEQPILTVVIPSRNISGPRIKNCIRSLQLQRLKNFTTIIADYGSSPEHFKELMKNLENFDCTIYRYQTDKIWSLSIARNIGIRRATGEIVVTVDADLILEQDVLNTIVKQYEEIENAFVVSCVCNLRKKINLRKIRLPIDYDKFRGKCKPRWGIGGLMSAPREWWYKVRGFEERMKGWGVEDDDMNRRANRDGRETLNIQNLELHNIKIYHQWHRKYTYDPKHKNIWEKNYKIYKEYKDIIIRNDENWGLWYES